VNVSPPPPCDLARAPRTRPTRRSRLPLLGAFAALVLAAGAGACSFNDVPGLQLPTAPLDTTTPRPPQSIQTWLDTNSTTVRSIDLSDTDFSDLAPMAAAIGNARIVMLGEQSGLDGTTFRAKARLVRYLHEQLGFSVLVFESGLYDMQAAWQRIEAGGDATEAARASVSAEWRNSAELQPLFAYVGERATTPQPLRLAGITPEFTGPTVGGTGARFAADLEGYLTSVASPLVMAEWWPAFREAVHRLATRADGDAAVSTADRAAIAAGLPPLRSETTRLVNVAQPDAAGFWITAILALESQYRLLTETLTPELRGNLRDSSMAESLVWLSQARYPGRKLIVWTSAAASLRSPRELFTPAGVASGHERAVLGTLARTTLGDVIYSIGFLAGRGSYGPVAPSSASPVRPLVAPLPESWDGLFLATGKPYAFLHLRREVVTSESQWILGPRVARAINYQQAVARWPNVYDGFFFTAIMAPATARGTND
jgi:erythromycin esterase